jgi:alpha-beta hydrolase superfamily lysophospholipase
MLRILKKIGQGVMIVVLSIIVIRAFDARRLPELSAWHELPMDAEFQAGAGDSSFDDYLAAETAVFAQVDSMLESNKATATLRFDPVSIFNSQNHERDWNRTTELVPASRTGVALLLHGASDSPYSMRPTAELMVSQGFHVLVLRLPGHGTTPGGLGQARWEDWRAAVTASARHLDAIRSNDEPMVVAGYSTGGALAVDLALDALSDDTLPQPDRLILLSPAIGITPFAFFASWHRTLAWMPYFSKFSWEVVLPEYDPYKYNSFPKAAGNETWELTRRVQRRLRQAASSGDGDRLPPIAAFVPLVDATVRTPDTVNRLFDVLNRRSDELVIYDINRFGGMREFLRAGHRELLDRMESDDNRHYRLTVVSNREDGTREVVARTFGSGLQREVALDAEWPFGIHSMSHVAVPFPPGDPWYGDGTAAADHPTLGRLNAFGERNMLIVSPAQVLRLRYNPFFDYQSSKILELVGAPQAAD